MFFKRYLYIFVPVIVVCVCSLLFLTTLDKQVNDRFLRSIPSLREDKSVLLITVDDAAIEQVGIFPWTRDILADAIVFLREMGANTVVFDLSYLDNSPVRVDPGYVQDDLPEYIDNGFRRINDTMDQVLDGFAGGYFGSADAAGLKEQIRDFNNLVRNELEVSIEYVTRDVDAYFAQTLKLFGNSYLTLTMVSEQDIIGETATPEGKSFTMNPDTLKWLESHIALNDIEARQDTRTPEMLGIIPAIFKLISQSRGAGFVNAETDPDGYRRRVHLVLKHNDRYYGHLALVALRESLGNPAIEVSNSFITLKNVSIKGAPPEDIRIPRDQNGSVLVKWPKKNFYDYNILSSWRLIEYCRLEEDFVRNLNLMAESGIFDYWDGGESPLDKYKNAEYIRELLYAGENSGQEITFATYKDFRQDYLESSRAFLEGPYEEYILADAGDDPEILDYVNHLFRASRTQYQQLLDIRETISDQTGGAFCIIGVAATSMTDYGLTAFQDQYPNMGIYGAISNMILSREFLDDAPVFLSFIIALALSLALSLVIKRLNDVGKSIIAGISTLAITAGAFLLFFIIFKRYLGVVVPFVSVTLTFLSLSAINFFSTAREKSFLRSAFSRYLAPQVIDEIISDPSKLNLGGEKRQMTVIFTDIRGFSTISEQMDPADLVNLLNQYLTTMSNIVMENRGTVDKYEGDAIIAFFGAPIYMEEHALLACRTAIQMKKAEAALNARVAAEKLSPAPLFTRIGINTGDMVVGNMGTPNKMEYTVMGNAVNLAARLEGVNKQYDTGGIMISEYTREQIGDAFVLRSLDRVRVVGINTPLRLYELLDVREEASPAVLELSSLWEQAIERYEALKFTDAAGIFQSIIKRNQNDRVAQLYLNRCEGYLKTPPPAEWDGVNNLTQK
jgi:adenylate cyclase